MDSSALAVSAETKNDALTGNEYMQKRTKDRRFQGNQSLAHGNILFEICVFGSVRVAHFFTHSREAPGLVGRLNDVTLARVHPVFQIKIWEMFYFVVTGCGGIGE